MLPSRKTKENSTSVPKRILAWILALLDGFGLIGLFTTELPKYHCLKTKTITQRRKKAIYRVQQPQHQYYHYRALLQMY